MDFTEKSESLAVKMNKITAKFSDNLDLADELVIEGTDIVDCVEAKTQDIGLVSDDITPSEIINLSNMVEDFKFVRETLRENTENARRVLTSVTLDLLDSEDEKRASLIMSFAELNRAVADNMKLYVSAYKDISSVLLNIEKIKGADSPQTVNQNMFVGTTVKTTAEIIKELGNTKT